MNLGKTDAFKRNDGPSNMSDTFHARRFLRM
jgi:hypothetical protein